MSYKYERLKFALDRELTDRQLANELEAVNNPGEGILNVMMSPVA
jgi:hypothetical protein